MDPAAISPALAIFLIAFGFGFIIFVHEMGHFLVAKAVGIHCTQFAIGFGQSLLTWRKGMGFRVGTTEKDYYTRIAKHLNLEMGENGEPPEFIPTDKISKAAAELGLGETEYRFNWMPLGGYVKMVGQEDMDPTALSKDPRAFNNAPIWARMCVISAGVVMNAIFAIIFFVGAFLYGVAFPPAQIGAVTPGSTAATTISLDDPNVVGLKMGDVIVKLNGETPSDFMDVSIASALSAKGTQVSMTIKRPTENNKQYEFILNPKVDPTTELRSLGISPPVGLKLTSKIANISDKDQASGVKPSMLLTAVNGQPVTQYWQVLDAMKNSNGAETAFTFAGKDDASITVNISPVTGMMSDTYTDDEAAEPEANILGLTTLTRIDNILEGSPATDILQEDDIVLSVGEAQFPSIGQMIDVVENSDDKPLDITVLRDGQPQTLSITARGGKIGVGLHYAIETNRIRNAIDNSPFAALNLVAGSTITAINGQAVNSIANIRTALQNAPANSPIQVTSLAPLAGATPETASLTVTDSQATQLADLGWYEPFPFAMLRVMQRADSVSHAIAIGVDKTKLYMAQTYVTLARLLDGGVKVHHMRGPVGIAHEGTRIAEQGLTYLVFFLGLISVNLAVINFLPLPIVDGGQFLMLIWEKVRGKPVPAGVQNVIMIMGLTFLGTLFLYITFNDVTRLLGF